MAQTAPGLLLLSMSVLVAKRSELFSWLLLSPYYSNVPISGIGRYVMWQSGGKFEETIGFRAF